jgi:hypothetical protein
MRDTVAVTNNLSPSMSAVAAQRAATGDTDIIASPGPARQVVIDAILISNEAATANLVLLKAAGSIFFRYQLAATIGSGVYLTDLRIPCGPNHAIQINDSGATAVGYTIYYHVEDVTA